MVGELCAGKIGQATHCAVTDLTQAANTESGNENYPVCFGRKIRCGMHRLENLIPPPLVGATIAVLMWLCAGVGPQWSLPHDVKMAITGVLVTIGIAFDFTGLVAFLKRKTTINPLKPQNTTALVTDGIYSITRNPMYVGMAFLLAAWAIWLSALVPLAGPLVFAAYITRFQILPEERALGSLFGDAFDTYAARVRRWL